MKKQTTDTCTLIHIDANTKSQSQKVTDCKFQTHNIAEMTKITETENRVGAARGESWGWRWQGPGCAHERATQSLLVVMEWFCVLTVVIDT